MNSKYHVWIILIGTFISNAAYWMSWPFLTVILYKEYGLMPDRIGAIFSVSIILSALGGIYLAYLSDKFGREKLIFAGCLIGVSGFLLLGMSSKVTLLLAGLFSVSMSKAIVDPVSKALFGGLSMTRQMREAALQLRYFAVNLGAAFGPLLGYYLNISASREAFTLTAFAFAAYLFMLIPIIKEKKINDGSGCGARHLNFMMSMRIIANDRTFLVLVIMNILLWIVFAQFETTLALYLALTKSNEITKSVGLLFMTNTISILLIQFPMLSLLSRMSISQKIYLGLFILSSSQAMFAFTPAWDIHGMVISTVVFSVGEVILVTTLNILVDQMAKRNLRSSYFAISSLYRLGCGTYIGSCLLQYYGAIGLYLGMVVVCVIIAMLYAFVRSYKSLPILATSP